MSDTKQQQQEDSPCCGKFFTLGYLRLQCGQPVMKVTARDSRSNIGEVVFCFDCKLKFPGVPAEAVKHE